MIAGASLPDGKYTMKIRIGSTPQPKAKPKHHLALVSTSNQKEEPIDKKEKASPFTTYKLIPHGNVKNDKLDQFSDVIADSYQEIIERIKSGISIPDRVFFETVMTNKTYENYLTTNSGLSELVKQQAQTVYKHVTLQEQENIYDGLNAENVLAYDFKLKFHYFMSLKTDRRLQELPLAEILEISRFMSDGDKVIIQFGFQASESNWYKEAEQERKDFDKKKPKQWRKKEVSSATEFKSSGYGFDFVLRVLISSADPRRQKRIARGIILALKQLNHDNELVEKQIKYSKNKKFIEDMKNYHIYIPFLFGKRQIITEAEIAHFIKLPQRTLQSEYPIVDTVSKPELSLPDELFMSNVPGVEVGEVTEKGKTRIAKIPVVGYGKTALKYVLDAYCLPEFVFGEMGSGKTGEAIHRAHSAITLGQTAFFFDTSDGEAVKELHNSLPADYPEEKIIHLDLTNKEWPIALSWAFNNAKNSNDELQAAIAKEAGKMFLRQFISGMSTNEFTNRMDRYLSAAARASSSAPLDIELALTSPAYREELLKRKGIGSQLDVVTELEHLQDKSKRGSEDISVDGVLSRLRILSSDQFRSNLFYQTPSKPLDFRHYADNSDGGYGYCVTIYVDKNSYGPDGQEAIMTYLLAKVLLEGAYSRVDISQDQRKPFVVILDEPHRFIKGEMASKLGEDAAVELRKYRCKLVMMNHSREQLGKLWDAFESGGIQVTMYKSKNVKAFQDMAPIIAPLDPVEAWSSLGQHEAVVTKKLPSKKEVSFICHMAHPPKEVKDRSERREQCARELGRNWKEVSKEIQDRRAKYLQKDLEWRRKIEEQEKEAKRKEQEEKQRMKEEAKKKNQTDKE